MHICSVKRNQSDTRFVVTSKWRKWDFSRKIVFFLLFSENDAIEVKVERRRKAHRNLYRWQESARHVAHEKGAGARVRKETCTRVHVHAVNSGTKYNTITRFRSMFDLNTYSNRRFPKMSSVVRKNVSSSESSSATAT